MSEIDPQLHDPLSALRLRDVHAMTAPTATYQEQGDPELILRRGLVEEIFELKAEPNIGELGDTVWYVSEISRYHSIDPKLVLGGRTLDEYQRWDDKPMPTVFDSDGQAVSFENKPAAMLAITALRVVDVMNPKDDGLWYGLDGRISLAEALADLMTAASIVADKHDIKLSDAIQHTIQKLTSRPRKPHVIDEQEQKQEVTTGRSRLTGNPVIAGIISSAVIRHASSDQ